MYKFKINFKRFDELDSNCYSVSVLEKNKQRFSLVYIDVEAKVSFILDVRLMEGHLEVIVDEVDNEVGEPWLFAFSLEKAAEETETLLAEMVAEDLEGHQILILSKTLGE